MILKICYECKNHDHKKCTMRKQRSSVPCECKCLNNPKYDTITPKNDGTIELRVTIQHKGIRGYVKMQEIDLNTTHKQASDELIRFVQDWAKHWKVKE